MVLGTDIFLWHPDELDPLPIAEKISAIMLDWGYERGYPEEKKKKDYYAGALSGSYRMPNDTWDVKHWFTDLDELLDVVSSMEGFQMGFHNPVTRRLVGFEWSSFSSTDKPLESYHEKQWRGGFSGIDLAPCWAVEHTHPNSVADQHYYTMEEVLTAYNLIKKIFVDVGFHFAAAHSEAHYFAFGEQQGADVGFDRLMRLDRNGVNRLIIPYEECRRIEMKDLRYDSATKLPCTGIAEYAHFVPLKIQKPPYNVD